MRGGESWRHDWMSWLPEPGQKIDGWLPSNTQQVFFLFVSCSGVQADRSSHCSQCRTINVLSMPSAEAGMMG